MAKQSKKLHQKVIVRIITVLALCVTVIWFVVDPGFEPFIGILIGVGGVIASFDARFNTNKRVTTGLGIISGVIFFVGLLLIINPFGTTTSNQLTDLTTRGGEAYQKGWYQEALNYYDQAIELAREPGNELRL